MSAVATETPAPTTGVLGAAHRVRESAQHVWSQQKPMSEILDANATLRPVSFGTRRRECRKT